MKNNKEMMNQEKDYQNIIANKSCKKMKKKKIGKINKGENNNYPLVCYHELPEYMKDNEFILNYYRADWPIKQALFSIFRWHNETLNVWTHLLGFILFVALTISNVVEVPQLPDFKTMFIWNFPTSGNVNVSNNSKEYFGGPARLIDLKQDQQLQLDMMSTNRLQSETTWPFYWEEPGLTACLLKNESATHKQWHYSLLELAFRKEFGDISATSSNENICMKICRHILIWVEEQTYWIASRFLMLGFELDLYSTGEYCMVYWYIYIILIKLAEKTHMRAMTSNEISKRKGKKKIDLVKDGGKYYQLPPAILFLQCHLYIAEGLTVMLAALRNEKQIYLSTGPFNSEHERFVQHFELLLKACLPDHVSYYSFEETTAHALLSNVSMYNCFKEAQRIAKEQFF
ncbi:hypothetical protein K7X08_003975 [Anisodus acutangulus]|uniref:NAA35-like TPR repeats domain-containing protein n=1 Tax=Anisodus acutangulus TaxID=402998 RepID=A0A9Q1RJA5_9SOLA|nr:hypothetical protein K7X08_003975 [Anisodus acutangulus]